MDIYQISPKLLSKSHIIPFSFRAKLRPSQERRCHHGSHPIGPNSGKCRPEPAPTKSAGELVVSSHDKQLLWMSYIISITRDPRLEDTEDRGVARRDCWGRDLEVAETSGAAVVGMTGSNSNNNHNNLEGWKATPPGTQESRRRISRSPHPEQKTRN